MIWKVQEGDSRHGNFVKTRLSDTSANTCGIGGVAGVAGAGDSPEESQTITLERRVAARPAISNSAKKKGKSVRVSVLDGKTEKKFQPGQDESTDEPAPPEALQGVQASAELEDELEEQLKQQLEFATAERAADAVLCMVITKLKNVFRFEFCFN